MNRADLIETLAQHLNGDRGEAAEVLDTLLQTITYEIAAGGKVVIAGFGTFETVARPARVVKDPRTGRSRRVKARPVPHFRPAAELRDYASGVKKPPPSQERVTARRTANAAARRLLRDTAAQELARHLTDFDPRQPSDYLFAAPAGSSPAVELAAAAAQPAPIPWPASYQPTPTRLNPKPTPTSPLPRADVLVVTYTVAAAHALADVFTPGWSTSRWYRYRSGWQRLKTLVPGHTPSKDKDQAGRWAAATIGGTSVVIVRADVPLPGGDDSYLQALWTQMIDQVRPRMVISTGTAGGIGPVVVGDVVISGRIVGAAGTSSDPPSVKDAVDTSLANLRGHRLAGAAKTLIAADAGQLPSAGRAAKIWTDTRTHPAVVWSVSPYQHSTIDQTTVAVANRTIRVAAREDIALALACAELSDPPSWVAVRNVSHSWPDEAAGEKGKRGAAISYEQNCYWTSVDGAIACWGLIAGTPAVSRRARAEATVVVGQVDAG